MPDMRDAIAQYPVYTDVQMPYTPMQAPGGPQVGGMDQAEWYRMYTGGR